MPNPIKRLTPADSKWVDYVFAEVERMGGPKEWNR
jgi:hypothetical protein